MRKIAVLLTEVTPHKDEEKAQIVAKALIWDNNAINAYGILELNCELLSERVHLITHGGRGRLPPDLAGCILMLIWASEAVDVVPELAKVRKQFLYRYGREFKEAALRNAGGVVNERVTLKLAVRTPTAHLMQVYLETIADKHGVVWKQRAPLKASSEMYEALVY